MRMLAHGREGRQGANSSRHRISGPAPAGRDLIDQAFGAHMHNERRLLDTLSPEEAAQLETSPTAWPARIEPPRPEA
ncbi:hypothetical protein [Streptomyces pratensis]|uniref:hypothetical protein n=1 Tax=Streptomyces pratensis TaxID=1169025 RepID=UPI0036446C0D